MQTKPLRTAALAALAAGLLLAGGARADEAPGAESTPVEIPEAESVEPPAAELPVAEPLPPAATAELPPLATDVYDGEAAYDDWQSTRPWRYGTQYFFPLTRGMGEAGIPWPARPFLWLISVPFDVGHLPWAVMAGLYGR